MQNPNNNSYNHDLLQEAVSVSGINSLSAALNVSMESNDYIEMNNILSDYSYNMIDNQSSMVFLEQHPNFSEHLNSLELDFRGFSVEEQENEWTFQNRSCFDEQQLKELAKDVLIYTENCDKIGKICESYIETSAIFLQLRDQASQTGNAEYRVQLQDKLQEIFNALQQEIINQKDFVQKIHFIFHNLHHFHVMEKEMWRILGEIGTCDKNSDKEKDLSDIIQRVTEHDELKFCIERYQTLFKVAVQTEANIANAEKYFAKINPTYVFEIDLQNQIHQIIEDILKDSLWILKQPPRVIQTKRSFECVLALVCIGNDFKIDGDVKLTILSENMLKAFVNQTEISSNPFEGNSSEPLRKRAKLLPPVSWQIGAGIIINNVKKIECTTDSVFPVLQMKNTQITKIKRDNRGIKPVTEDKLGFLYHLNIKINDTSYDIFAHSNATIVTVHHNQDVHARATIFWDSAFSNTNRTPFEAPKVMKWGILKNLLDKIVIAKTGGTGLSAYNTEALYKKITKTTEKEDNDREISFDEFCRNEIIPGRPFTFWEWFDKTLILIHKYFPKQWNEGNIAGFVNKQEATEMLEISPAGRFLIRFSDTYIGGISIVYTERKFTNDNKRLVVHLSPIDAKRLEVRDLNTLLHDLENLTCVLPTEKRKSIAFPKDSSDQGPTGDYTPFNNPGYIELDD